MFKKNRNHSVKVVIECAEHYKNVPYSIGIDFDELLRKKKINGTFDRFSVLVRKIDGRTGELKDIHFNLSDDFLTGNRGRVNWLIEDTDDREYVVFFDSRENGPFHPPEYIGLVGNGDCLRFNDGKPHPLHVGMGSNPIAVDWDGDGRTDIISTQVYSFTFGSKWHCIRFFRNEGTNENPVFGDGIPLRAVRNNSYEIIDAGSSIEIVDWNDDGLLDMIVYPYTAAKEIYIYLNTGRKDNTGLPVLEMKYSIPLREKSHFSCMRVVDWKGRGRKDILGGCILDYNGETSVLNIDDPLWFEADEEEKKTAQWPRWYYKSCILYYENLAAADEKPVFEEPVMLKDADGNVISFYASSCFEVMDWDGDGRLDLLVQDHPEIPHKGYAGIRFYRNIGTDESPIFKDCGRIDGFADRVGLQLRKADTPAFNGFLATHGSTGGKIMYYRYEGRDGRGTALYKDMGFVMQRNTYMNSYAGYANGTLCDWDCDGDWDLISGGEMGRVFRFENIGSQKKPVFKEIEFFTQGGRPIVLVNGPWDDPASLMEAPLGQTAPMYVDWDGDGTLDLMVIIGRRLYFYRNSGTSSVPVLEDPVEITADGGEKVAKHRNKPAIVDWDGDGLLDIIGHDPEENGLYLFKRYRDEKTGQLRLAKGIPFMYEDGKPVSPREWHRYTKFFNVGDWNGKGSYDIFLSTCDLILYLENTGTNEEPLFKRPVRLAADGKPIVIGHHICVPFPVDWDKSGKTDLLISGESGLYHLFRRNFLEGVHSRIKCRIEE